ncbi:CD1375 family protein [Paenibacillus sp. JX-17]|uniref:CD1375 family protein n=1 Tax=Paenibacillus lacisoli TaxID=3064525 RepID=A0ABT9CGP5_9BACL|nr:CD1375 family protein [Paenibacillus sp. JX-17]MDO7908415.1 CD1375 family protein [Paenibacillus sp. JX-17]
MDKTAFAKIYLDLVKAGRRDESSVPEEIKTEYEQLKEAESNA